ncbi:hypothetical protein B0O99DRAFT_741565 [Bisporella sp. PMI_857]|nr:hypothetical protein B0O99DRAFT_741565 [Bisporella sp. PMI_857]
MALFQSTVEKANAAWLANYTVGDKRWRLQQLHGLHRLVIDNRDAIVSSLAQESQQPAFLYEREIAVFVTDLQSYISKVNSNKFTSSCVRSTTFGPVTIQERPRGVCLIISNVQNFIRFGLAPLAASIAANNVTIMATSADHNNAFISLLSQKWGKYLSPNTLFLVPGISAADIKEDAINHIAVIDSSTATFSTILQYPETHFYSVAEGYNVAIIDEGKKDWETIAKQIYSSTANMKLPSDNLSAVFVRPEDVSELRNELRRQRATEKNSTDSNACQIPDCTSWDKDTFSLNSNWGEGSPGTTDSPLESKLRQTQAAGALLVVTVTSLEKALDLLSGLSSPILQVALLAPGSKRVVEYASRWTNAHTFSVGSIQSVLHPTFNTFISPEPLRPVFPTTLFSRAQIIATKSSEALPSSVPAIRASYEKLIPPLKPEPRGERIGFFTQAEYLIKGVVGTTTILAAVGLYFGAQSFKNRY